MYRNPTNEQNKTDTLQMAFCGINATKKQKNKKTKKQKNKQTKKQKNKKTKKQKNTKKHKTLIMQFFDFS